MRPSLWLLLALAARALGISVLSGARGLPLSRKLWPAAASALTATASDDLEAAYLQQLSVQQLPSGFRVGVCGFQFSPVEVEDATAVMNLTLIALDEPTLNWAATFTRNRFPGAPVKVGRSRLAAGGALQAIIVNNKISNVCSAGDGVAASEQLCDGVAEALGLEGGAQAVLPLSTGVIGWQLPLEHMLAALPEAAAALSHGSALPAAQSIMTTDRFPKLRSVATCGGTLVGFAKGAGMIEPDMATMLAFVLTDVAVAREDLQPMLSRCADVSFNCASVDADQSTSDSLVCLSTGPGATIEGQALADFEAALTELCTQLSADLVRNGEGTTHVIRVAVGGAPSAALARGVGKAVVNSPLFKSAVAGNDPNVGRLVSAVGSYLGREAPTLPLEACAMRMGGQVIFEKGAFAIDGAVEDVLHQHMLDASLAAEDGSSLPYPPHERCVEINVDLGAGSCGCVVHGSDLTHEYVSINADYRS